MGIRKNIILDVDAYEAAAVYADAKGIALGTAVSELIRRGEEAPEQPSSRLVKGPHGYLVMKKTGRVVTPAMVKESSEDDLD